MALLLGKTRARSYLIEVVSRVYICPQTHQDAYVKYVWPFYMSAKPQFKKIK